MYSYISFLLLLFGLLAYIVWRNMDPTTRAVLSHLNARERLIYYGIPAGYGLSMPALAMLVASLLHLNAPRDFFLKHLMLALCFIAPVYAVVGILFQRSAKDFLRRVVTESQWAKEQGIDAEQIKL